MTHDRGDLLGDFMRWPTPKEKLEVWWRNALRAGKGKPIVYVNEEPQVGYYQTRMVKGGPMVPARIWMYQPIDADSGELVGDEILQAEINGAYAVPEAAWPGLCGNPITEQEWRYLTATVTWAMEFAPDDPRAKPKEAINNLTTPLPF